MHRFAQHRPSPALVVACAALAVALSGTGYAAFRLPAGSVGVKQLKKNAVTSAKVKNRSLLGIDFKQGQLPAGPRGPAGPAGPAGPKGDPGARGTTGAVGTPGAPAASMITGNTGWSISSGSIVLFLPPMGEAQAAGGRQLSPHATVVARDLSAQVDNAPGGSASVSFTLDANETNTALVCTISGSAKTCNSGAATATIGPSSRLALVVDQKSTAALGQVRWAFRALTP